MNLSRLKPASDCDVMEWLEKKIPNLTPSQKEKIHDDEIIRFAPFDFYEPRAKEKISFLWRLTIILIPFYFVGLLSFLPIKMIFTGKWGYGRKFQDNVHGYWMNKLKL